MVTILARCCLCAGASGSISRELEIAIEKMNTFNAWQIDAEAKRVLEAVGITNLNQKVGQLSGTADQHLFTAGDGPCFVCCCFDMCRQSREPQIFRVVA